MFLYDALAVTHIITLHPVRAEGLVSSHNIGLTEFKCVLLHLSVTVLLALWLNLFSQHAGNHIPDLIYVLRALFYARLIYTIAPCPLWRLPRHRVGAD